MRRCHGRLRGEVARPQESLLAVGLFDDLIPEQRKSRRRQTLQLTRPRFERPIDWKPHDELPELHGVVGLDAETKDPDLSRGMGSSWPYKAQGIGFVAGWGISYEGGDFYLPLRHSEGNIDPLRVERWLRAQVRKPDVTVCCANVMYDLGWAWRYDIEPLNLPYDPQGEAALLDEYRSSYSLESLSQEFLGRGKLDQEFIDRCARAGLLNPKANMDMVPAWIAEPYGTEDAVLARQLHLKFRAKLEAENLQKIYDLERECFLVGMDMQKRGMRVDLDRAARKSAELIEKRDAAIEQVYQLTNVRIDANDNPAIARALRVENSEIVFPQTSQGRDSIRADFLESLDSPVGKLVRSARQYDKAVSTFFDGYIFGCEVAGRIHSTFHPLRRADENGTNGTVSGRWASSDPNLTNVPQRIPEIRDAVRGCCIPEEDHDWGKLDYAGQEPRLTVHFAALIRRKGRPLRGALEMVERFKANPLLNLHTETGERMGLPMPEGKTKAKIINLAITYGAGGAKTCKQLGLPTEWIDKPWGRLEIAGPEGRRLLKLHHETMPFIKEFQEICTERGEQNGFIITIGGRRCRLEKRGKEYMWAYTSCNKLIQGSAADQMKRASVLIRRAGIPLTVIVHDEADLSVPKGDAGVKLIAQVKEIMESAYELLLPVVADVKIGSDWAAVG
jgi:DNA polymerase I-like protein with 3'-5' exonuclease and polymerase domains